ncbi:hypothetical protein AWZ03_005093 [Drosophila navojoa]|uniref:Ig-like domain-containing protein n=1 Tax=Drosophila navojoa TaxID=7232 RepID=A0A484BID0_DRONA|nr:hypothetical protein AWZ03_005093 [Drosophila navojoa]
MRISQTSLIAMPSCALVATDGRPLAVPTATILGGPDLYVDKGSTINLTCIIKFSPEPPTHIFWYHQDKVLSEETAGGRLKFKTIKSEETKSILLIYDADLLHSGKYSCYPSNTEIASIRVHVLQGERPEAMQTNAAPAAVALAWAGHTKQATQAVKVISTMVAAFVLLEACCTLLLQGQGGGRGGREAQEDRAPPEQSQAAQTNRNSNSNSNCNCNSSCPNRDHVGQRTTSTSGNHVNKSRTTAR